MVYACFCWNKIYYSLWCHKIPVYFCCDELTQLPFENYYFVFLASRQFLLLERGQKRVARLQFRQDSVYTKPLWKEKNFAVGGLPPTYCFAETRTLWALVLWGGVATNRIKFRDLFISFVSFSIASQHMG